MTNLFAVPVTFCNCRRENDLNVFMLGRRSCREGQDEPDGLGVSEPGPGAAESSCAYRPSAESVALAIMIRAR